MLNRFTVLILSLGLVTLAALTIFNLNPLLFDEVLFPPNVELMERLGFGRKFLTLMKDQAPGPLYEFIHLPLKSITGLKPPGIRIVNLVLLLIIMFVLFKIFKKNFQYETEKAWIAALNIIAIPTIWQVTGLALTEIPAMVFAVISFYFLTLILSNDHRVKNINIIYSIIAGVSLSFAILGRSPYLLLVFPFLITLLYYKQDIRLYIPFIIFTMALTLPVFFIWGGLIPPLQVRQVSEGWIKPWHGILACSYAGIIGIIINPKWFTVSKKIAIIFVCMAAAFFLINFLWLGYEFAPMSVTIQKIIGYKTMIVYKRMISPILAAFGLYFVFCCFVKLKEKNLDKVYTLAVLSSLSILATAATVTHQFSSRYVVQAAPFLLFMFIDLNKDDKWRVPRLIVGMTIGFLSLNTYAKII